MGTEIAADDNTGTDRNAAKETLERMKVLDEQIKKANDAVFDVEEKDVLRKVIINKNTAL